MKPFYLSSETVLPIKTVLPFKRNSYRYVAVAAYVVAAVAAGVAVGAAAYYKQSR